ncbi:MAG TPA: hypothetical protein VFM79_05295 [Pelobium sp.]|nr:hypothetical protein [Pelobium sp.]
MELETPSTHPDLFFSPTFGCPSCSQEFQVFIYNNYNLFGIYYENYLCSACGEVKDAVCDGDLVFIENSPNTDEEHWQLQCCYVDEKLRVCTDCMPFSKLSYKNFKPICPKCEMDIEMNYKYL